MVFGSGSRTSTAHIENDAYPTPAPFTEALIRRYQLPERLWEPASGAGWMATVLQAHGFRVTATDISTGDDFLTCDPRSVDAIVTNPPYSLADAFIERALSLAPVVAMLLPVKNLAGQQRYQRVWHVHPPAVIIHFCGRMNIPADEAIGVSHNYAFNHAWVVWEDSHRGPAAFHMVPPDETGPTKFPIIHG